MQLFANINLTLRKDGKLVHRERGHNRVVDGGEVLAAERFDPGSSEPAVDWVALGSGDAPIVGSDTGLGAEHSGSRTQSTTTVVVLSTTSWDFTVVATGTWVVNEVGLFNDAVTGTLMARFLTQGFTMVSGNELQIIWSIRFKGWDEESSS